MNQVDSSQKKTLKFVLLIFLVIICWYLGRQYNVEIEDIRSKLEKYPLGISGLIFVCLYVGLTSIFWFGPKDVLRISAALLFGGYISTLFVWISEIFNSLVMFYVSRLLGRDFVAQRVKMKTDQLDQVSRSRSFMGVIAWRINPIVPIRLTDLGYGLANIKFSKYIIPASIATVPRILWQQYILADIGMIMINGEFDKLMSYFSTNKFAIKLSILYFLAVIICIVISRIKRQNTT